MEILKKNWIYILVLILVIIIFFQTCNNGSSHRIKNDTTIIHDTTLINVKGDDVFKPVPYKVEVPVIIDSIQYLPDTTYDGVKQQYLKAMTELLTKNYYENNTEIEDSLGMKGSIQLFDTIQKNKIIGKGLTYNITYPKIKETITVTKYPDPKNQLYFGTSILGNKSQFVGGAKIDLSLKNRKDQIYEVGAQYWNNEIIYSVGTKWKISFKKK